MLDFLGQIVGQRVELELAGAPGVVLQPSLPMWSVAAGSWNRTRPAPWRRSQWREAVVEPSSPGTRAPSSRSPESGRQGERVWQPPTPFAMQRSL
jgi:hypothetical protein